MKKIKILVCLFFPLTFIAKSQDTIPLRIGIEIGFVTIKGHADSRWNIRQDLNNYGGNLNRIGMRDSYNKLFKNYLGVLPTFYFMKGRIGISSGLRLTMLTGKIGNQDIDDNQRYFFFRHPSPNDGIGFYRIRKIDEKVHYLSIPLEASIMLLGYRSNWQFYLKTGTEFGHKVYDKINMQFYSEAMQKYESELLEQITTQPNKFYIRTYLGFGLSLTQKNGIRYRIEITPVSHFKTDENNSLIIPENSLGGNFSVQFPAKMLFGK